MDWLVLAVAVVIYEFFLMLDRPSPPAPPKKTITKDWPDQHADYHQILEE